MISRLVQVPDIAEQNAEEELIPQGFHIIFRKKGVERLQCFHFLDIDARSLAPSFLLHDLCQRITGERLTDLVHCDRIDR